MEGIVRARTCVAVVVISAAAQHMAEYCCVAPIGSAEGLGEYAFGEVLDDHGARERHSQDDDNALGNEFWRNVGRWLVGREAAVEEGLKVLEGAEVELVVAAGEGEVERCTALPVRLEQVHSTDGDLSAEELLLAIEDGRHERDDGMEALHLRMRDGGYTDGDADAADVNLWEVGSSQLVV